jgi:hypothetical protein
VSTRPSLTLIHGGGQDPARALQRADRCAHLRLIDGQPGAPSDDALSAHEPSASAQARAAELMDRVAYDDIDETVSVLCAAGAAAVQAPLLLDLTGALACTLARQTLSANTARTRLFLSVTRLAASVDRPSLVAMADADPLGDDDDVVAFFVCLADLIECLLLSEMARYGNLSVDDCYRLADEAYEPCLIDRAAEMAVRGGETLLSELLGSAYSPLRQQVDGDLAGLMTVAGWREALADSIPDVGEARAARRADRARMRRRALAGRLESALRASSAA